MILWYSMKKNKLFCTHIIKKDFMLKTITLFGAVGSTTFCLYFWLIYAIWGNPFLDTPKSIDFFIYLLTVAGSIVYFRYLGAGKGKGITFLQGFTIGISVTLTMVVISTFFVYIFTEKIAPDGLKAHIQERTTLFEKNKASMIAHLEEQIKKANNVPKGVTAEKIHQEKIQAFQKLTAWDMAYIEVSKLFLGLFITLIVAVLIRK